MSAIGGTFRTWLLTLMRSVHRPPKPVVGVVKSLELIGSGPVGRIHAQKVGIKSKKPLRDIGSFQLRRPINRLTDRILAPQTTVWRQEI